MARTKKVKRYDFSGAKFLREPNLYVLECVKGDDVADLVLQIITANPGYDKYGYTHNYAQLAKTNGWASVSSYARNRLLGTLLENSPNIRDAFNKTIMEWYAGHEGVQEVYQVAAPSLYSWSRDNFVSSFGYYTDSWLSGSELISSGVLMQPRDYIDVSKVLSIREARTYIETNREQVFIEGDLVILRTPFVGRWDYDPTMRAGEVKPAEEPRYGTVMEQGTGTLLSQHGAKGSRQVSVLWFGKDEITEVPEKIIKLECRKGRKI